MNFSAIFLQTLLCLFLAIQLACSSSSSGSSGKPPTGSVDQNSPNTDVSDQDKKQDPATGNDENKDEVKDEEEEDLPEDVESDPEKVKVFIDNELANKDWVFCFNFDEDNESERETMRFNPDGTVSFKFELFGQLNCAGAALDMATETANYVIKESGQENIWNLDFDYGEEFGMFYTTLKIENNRLYFGGGGENPADRDANFDPDFFYTTP